MRGRGGGEGGLGTISSELLLWVSMAKREEGGDLETQVHLLSNPVHPASRNSGLTTEGRLDSQVCPLQTWYSPDRHGKEDDRSIWRPHPRTYLQFQICV